MTVNYTTNLALGQPVTGTESGTWGDDVNNAVTSYLDIAIAGGLAITVTTADVTLTLTQGTSSATNIGSTTAQYAILNISGAMTAARNLILPSSSRQYVINNNTTGGFALTVKGSATSGVTMVNGEKSHVFWNGSDYAKLSNAPGGAGSFTNLSATGNTTLGDASTDTVTVNGTATFNASPVISVTDNTNAALRITQLGTGNALLIEDSANPDSSPVLVDSTGNLISGYTTQFPTALTTASQVGIGGVASTSGGGVSILKYRNISTVGPDLEFVKSRSSTIGVNSTVANADLLGTITWSGADGTGYVQAASISAAVDGTPGTNDMPGRLTFSTTADGASSVTERMRIDSAGNVGIGTTSPQVKLEVSGSNNSIWSAATSTISGVTLTVGVVTGTIAIGDLVYGPTVQPYTRITAGSGSSWTVSVFQTVASTTLVGGPSYANTLIRITDTDTAQNTNQPTGGLQFYSSDTSSPTAGVGAYVAAMAETNTPDTSLVFGTRDNAGGGVDANERMRIESGGRLIVGYSASTGAAQNTNIQSQATGGQAGVSAFRWSNDAIPPRFQVGKSRSATIGTNTIVQSGDELGGLYFYGDDGTDLVSDAASIIATVDGTPGLNDMPGRLTFNTTADGAATPTERMRIDSAGNVQVQTGAVVVYQPTPAAISTGATLTNANLQTQLIDATGGTGTFTLTMPLGTTLETLVSWSAVNLGYDFSIICNNSQSVILAVNTGVTDVGSLVVSIGTSGRFRIRRTAANTFVLYRIS